MPATKIACGLALLLLLTCVAVAADLITDVMSPIVSYQYPENITSMDLAQGAIQSPFVSFQYLEDFDSASGMNGEILSRFVSYQYYEWPGDDILKLVSSPPVSYLYEFNFGLNFASDAIECRRRPSG